MSGHFGLSAYWRTGHISNMAEAGLFDKITNRRRLTQICKDRSPWITRGRVNLQVRRSDTEQVFRDLNVVERQATLVRSVFRERRREHRAIALACERERHRGSVTSVGAFKPNNRWLVNRPRNHSFTFETGLLARPGNYLAITTKTGGDSRSQTGLSLAGRADGTPTPSRRKMSG